MKGNYLAPSELLKLQKETGKSYWDLIGRPLYDEGKDEEKASSGQISALQQLLSDSIDDKYLIPKNIPNASPLNYDDRYGLTGDMFLDANNQHIAKFKGGKGRIDETVSERVLYNKLRALGFDHNSALGVIGNAMQESSLRYNVRAKSYSGLLQNHDSLRAAIEDLYGGYDLDKQLQYVSDWADGKKFIKEGKHRGVTTTYSGKYKKTGYKSPEEAAIAFMKMYERPVILDSQGKVIGYQNPKERVRFAKNAAARLSGMQPQQYEVATTAAPEYIRRRPAQKSKSIQPWFNILSEDELRQRTSGWNPTEYRQPSTMSISQLAHNPSIPEFINRSSATATYPRTTVLPSILEYIGQQQKLFNSSPLFKPAL